MRRLALVLVLAAALALAGCLGGGGDAADTSSTDDSGDQDQLDNRTDTNETEVDQGPVWNRSTFEGSAPGPNAVFLFTPGPSHNVTVVDGTKNLTVNATSSDGELLVDIYPPGCEETDNQRGEDCSHTADTQDGEMGQWTADDPEPGTWTIQVSKGDPGFGSTSYEVTADRLEPAPASP